MDTAVSPTASQARAAVKYHLELQEEQEEEEKSVCDFPITSKDYQRLALYPGANGVVSFVYFEKILSRKKISENINFRVLVVPNPNYPDHLTVSGEAGDVRRELI